VQTKPLFVKGYPEVNRTLRLIEDDLRHIYNRMIERGETATAEKVRECYLEDDIPTPTLITASHDYIETCKAKEVGKRIKESTLTVYRNRHKAFASFLNHIDKERILVDEVNVSIMQRFIEWATIDQECSDEWAKKVINQIKLVLDWCIREEILDINRLVGFSHASNPPKYPHHLRPEPQNRLFAATVTSACPAPPAPDHQYGDHDDR